MTRDRPTRRAVAARLAALGGAVPLGGIGPFGTAATAQPAATAARPIPGGTLRLLWWQAPTLLNPHFAVGGKDQEAARIFYEPLAAWDADGNLVPVLADAIPSRETGDVASDGRSVVWRLKPGVRWHDGAPFTADDVVFNWRFAADPATAATSAGSYRDLHVQALDPLTVRVEFARPSPFWADAFVGAFGMLIPAHVFAPFLGPASRDAPANLAPVGTGPYRFVDFRPGDQLRARRNDDYHRPGLPHFDALVLKGGGDALSAARAVLQTGDFDFASNIQVEDDILEPLEAIGHGRLDVAFGGNLEFILLNATDPEREVDGERSALGTTHFAFSDPAVRRALDLLLDREAIARHIYGRTGEVSPNSVTGPSRFVSPNMHSAFDPAEANRLLDEAGWLPGSDGVRAKDGRPLRLVFQTTLGSARQKTQAIIKASARHAGIDIELRAVPSSVYFSSDVSNPDTFSKFYADMEMLTGVMVQPDPARWMLQYVSWEVASKANKWQGRNVCRWRDERLDGLYREAQAELDPTRRASLFIRMNDLVVGRQVLPLVHRAKVSAVRNNLVAPQSAWDNDLASLAEWHLT